MEIIKETGLMNKITVMLAICVVSVIGVSDKVYAQANPLIIKYVNGLDESIQLWFQPKGSREFIRPPVGIGPKGERAVSVSNKHTGKRYIVMRDEAQRDTHIGWVDIESVAASTSPVLLIEGETVFEQKEEKFTTQVPVQEVVIGPDGQPKTITRFQSEHRTRTVNVSKFIPKISTSVNGQWEPIQPSNTPD
jgi:hypothetical protein